MLRWTPLIATVTLLVAIRPAAAQDETVLVLGIRSPEGDDALARQITATLTNHVEAVPGWHASERRVSLSQMMVVNGCEAPDVPCLARIASGMGADRLVYGTLKRTAAGARYDFDLSLGLFDRREGKVAQTMAVSLPKRGAAVEVAAHAGDWVARLTGQPIEGPEQATLESPPVATPPPPAPTAAPSAPTPPKAAAPSIGHTAAPGPRARRITWPTYTAFAGTALLAGVSIYAFARVAHLHDDPEVRRWGDATTGFDATCARAEAASRTQPDANRAVDRCNQARRLEPVRWTFLALALATGGAGTYFLWRDLHSDAEAPGGSARASTTPVRIDATWFARGGRVTVDWTF